MNIIQVCSVGNHVSNVVNQFHHLRNRLRIANVTSRIVMSAFLLFTFSIMIKIMYHNR